MQPEIHLGPLTLQTFGIAFAVAFIAAGAVLGRRLKEIGKPTDWAYELVICALVGGIIGARLNYVIQNYDAVKGDYLRSLVDPNLTTPDKKPVKAGSNPWPTALTAS